MQDLNPYAIFIVGSFAVGFVARAVVGGYRRITRTNGEVEVEVVEEPSIDAAMNFRSDVGMKCKQRFLECKRQFLSTPPGGIYNPNKTKAEILKQLGKDHEQKYVCNCATLGIIRNPPVKIRILPPAANHEVFHKRENLDPSTFKERYYYNVIVRGEESQGPKVLSVGPAMHRKIVEAFTKPEDDDISDLVNGSDLNMHYIEPYHELVVDKVKCPAGEPDQVENWLKRTSDLSNDRWVCHEWVWTEL